MVRGRVTLKQVADRAGVSPATVSKVMNGRVGVGEATREAIEKLVDELGYVGISEMERPIRRQRDPLVELIIDSFESPYSLMIIAGATTAAEASGATIATGRLATIAREDPVRWAERIARSGRVGVVEVTSTFSTAREAALRAVGLPAVFIDPLDVARVAVYSVGATNWAGGLDATRHLAELGHRRIAFIGGAKGSACDLARRQGYATALEEYGLPYNPSIVVHDSKGFDEGAAITAALLRQHTPPTAIFTSSDVTALGALDAARQLGVSVPEQLSIVGFDDIPFASMSPPPLTTVHQPIREIGQAAVSMVMALAAGQPPPTRRIELATQLVVRGSTARCPVTGFS